MPIQNRPPQAAIFDLDGTLFQSETLLIPAYHQTFEQLRKEGLYKGETPPEQRILSSLGMLLEDIWSRVVPEAGEALKERANELLLYYQLEGLKNGTGQLYSGVEETLKEMHARGIRLFVASNGLEDYVKGVVRHKGIASCFEGLYSAGEYKTATKADMVALLRKHHGIENGWMVGDRSSDVEAGKKNGLDVIGCRYADFGDATELDGADVIIRRFPELLELLES